MHNKGELQQNSVNTEVSQGPKNIKEFVEISKKRLKKLLNRLQWTEEGALKNFNSNSKATQNSVNSGKNSEPLLPISCATKNSITIDEHQLKLIVKNPFARVPQNFSQLQLNYDREQKLRIYEYVVFHTEKFIEPEVTKPIRYKGRDMTFAEIVTMKKREKKKNEKKRKYRKSKPTHIEEVRNLVELQMQAMEHYITPIFHRSRSRERNYKGSSSKRRSRSRSYKKDSPSSYYSTKKSYCRKRKYSNERSISREKDSFHHTNKRRYSRQSRTRSRTRSLSRDKRINARERSQTKDKNKSVQVRYSHSDLKHKYREQNKRSRSKRRSNSKDDSTQNKLLETRDRRNYAFSERNKDRNRSRSRNRIHSKEKHRDSNRKRRSRTPSPNRKDKYRSRNRSSHRDSRGISKERDKAYKRRERSRSRNRYSSHIYKNSKHQMCQNQNFNIKTESMNPSHIKKEMEYLSNGCNTIKVENNGKEHANNIYNEQKIKIEPTTYYPN